MFGSNAVSQDYTFTQSENRLFTNQVSKAISTYVGNFDASKKDKENDSVKDADLNKKVLEKTVKGKDDSADKDENKVVDLFEEDDDSLSSFTYDGKADSSITTSFEALAAALGISGDKVTKGQLFAFLQSLISTDKTGDNSKEIAFVKNLIAKFDTISEGEDYITSFNGVNDPQDYETVTQDQVTPPVDIRI